MDNHQRGRIPRALQEAASNDLDESDVQPGEIAALFIKKAGGKAKYAQMLLDEYQAAPSGGMARVRIIEVVKADAMLGAAANATDLADMDEEALKEVIAGAQRKIADAQEEQRQAQGGEAPESASLPAEPAASPAAESAGHPPAEAMASGLGVTSSELRRATQAQKLLSRMQREALRHYDPLPNQEAFHRSQAPTRIIGGSNQAGKSQAAAADMAWLLTGTHPYDKRAPKGNGLFYAVGYDEKHIGNLIWPMLSHEGAIRVIRDEITGQWRAFKPWLPYDAAYSEKSAPAEPFLPSRFIKPRGISWHSKKDDCPSIIRFKNGTELHIFTSKGYPQKGTQIHGAWIDEEMEKDGWYAEIRARCMRFGGRVVWSATPEISTPQFFRLYQQAQKEAREGGGLVEKFWLLIDDNPYITAERKAEFKASLPERLVRVKYYGEFSVAGMLVYPEFSHSLHCVPSQVLPPSWSRYMVVDPGVSVCAVLFAAVPPDQEQVHVYRELYIKRCSAKVFAKEVSGAMGEYKTAFTSFIIDMQMGRQTELGTGKTVVEQYSEALEEEGVWSQHTGSGFVAGNADIAGREEQFRGWLEISPRTGKPTVAVHKDSCPFLLWEIEQQYYEKLKGEVSDRKRLNQNNHLVSCLEYLSSYDPQYYAPSNPTDGEQPFKALFEMMKSKTHQVGGGVRLGPMG